MIQASLSPYSSVLSSNGYCNICYNLYDLADNKPLLICTNDHSVCKQCLLSIKRRLRCPFCRGQVKLNRIRLNKEAVNNIQMKSRGISPLLSPQRSRNIDRNKIDDRLITENTNQRNIIVQEQEQPLYLDEEQFMDGGLSHLQSSSILEHCHEQKLITFLLLIGLQLPLGILNLLVAIKQPNRGCFDCFMPGSVITLRDYWRATGMIEIIISIVAICILVVECLHAISHRWRGIQLLTLLFAVEINCIMGMIVYLNLMTSPDFTIYSQPVKVCFYTNSIVNVATLMLQLFLIGRYPRFYFER